jgi:hypothetical protein
MLDTASWFAILKNVKAELNREPFRDSKESAQKADFLIAIKLIRNLTIKILFYIIIRRARGFFH